MEKKEKRIPWNKGMKLSDEIRQNMSVSHKGNIPWNKGIKTGPNLRRRGMEVPIETRQKISDTLKGNVPWNKGVKTGQIPWCKGKQLPLEMRNNISEALKGRKLSKEHCKNMSESRKGYKHSDKTKEKLSLGKMGELNPQWKGGITPKNEIIRGSEKYKQWRKSVFERDNYTCQITGLKISGEMEVHHIENFASYKEKRFCIENGITIHKKIHELFHKKYGYFNNTPEQIKKYKEEYKNGYND